MKLFVLKARYYVLYLILLTFEIIRFNFVFWINCKGFKLGHIRNPPFLLYLILKTNWRWGGKLSIWFSVSPFCLTSHLCVPSLFVGFENILFINLYRIDVFLSLWHNMSIELFIKVLACNTPINNDHCWVLETNGTWISIISYTCGHNH